MKNNTISEITRREIMDYFITSNYPLADKMSEIEFLQRLYPLQDMPSSDSRFKNAEGDIRQHRINNYDWGDSWIWTDTRFNILYGSDDNFIRFLCLLLHPTVRDPKIVKEMLIEFNKYLANDNWELIKIKEISKHPIFSGVYKKQHLPSLTSSTIVDYQFIKERENIIFENIDIHPDVAIGASKELIESCLKTILNAERVEYSQKDDIPQLSKKAMKTLNLLAEDIPEYAKGKDSIRKILSSLIGIANYLAELRNLYGSGHGKDGRFIGLQPRHARLVAGAAITYVNFIFETFQKQQLMNEK